MDRKTKMTDTVQKHFVTFVSPGTMFAETTTEEIESWDISKALERAKEIIERHGAKPYSFRFSTRTRGPGDLDSKVTDNSPFYFFGIDPYNIDQVREKFPEERTLIRNMENNGDYIKGVAVPREGWKGFFSIDKSSIVLDGEGKPVEGDFGISR